MLRQSIAGLAILPAASAIAAEASKYKAFSTHLRASESASPPRPAPPPADADAPADADLLRAESWTKSPAPVFLTGTSASQFGPGWRGRGFAVGCPGSLRRYASDTRAQVIR